MLWAALLTVSQADTDFRLEVGARWVYLQEGRESMILDAVETSAVGDTKTVTLRIRGGTFFWSSEDAFLAAGTDGVRHCASTLGDTLLVKEPFRLLLPPRLEKGASWEGGGSFFKASILGPEKVVVPAGTFEAWKIDYRLVSHFGTENDFIAWYAPGTGFVRLDYWQESTLGAKKPLARPYRLELSRFEPRRAARPVPRPPLADRAAAEAALGRLSDPAIDARGRAADELFAMGRGVLPLLEAALDGAADPELRARLSEILRRFPALELTIKTVRDKGKVGQPLPLRFALRNLTARAVDIVPSLDDSDVARSPRYVLTFLDDQGVVQRPQEVPVCALVNPLLARDFVRLEPGEEFDPLGPGTFGHYMLAWTPARPGVYTVDAVYDATGKIPNAWKGSADQMDPEVRKRLEAMPRGRYEAKRLTIVVEP